MESSTHRELDYVDQWIGIPVSRYKLHYQKHTDFFFLHANFIKKKARIFIEKSHTHYKNDD